MTDEQWRDLASEQWEADADLQIGGLGAADPEVSHPDDDDSYVWVQAWVRVERPE